MGSKPDCVRRRLKSVPSSSGIGLKQTTEHLECNRVNRSRFGRKSDTKKRALLPGVHPATPRI